MVYQLNGRKNICIFGNVITIQIILRNEIPGNKDLLKVKYGYQIKKSSISKINVDYYNTNLFSLYYKPWHIRNTGIFITCGIFRTLEHSKVRPYLDPCQTHCSIFRKFFQFMIVFAGCSFLDYVRCLAGF